MNPVELDIKEKFDIFQTCLSFRIKHNTIPRHIRETIIKHAYMRDRSLTSMVKYLLLDTHVSFHPSRDFKGYSFEKNCVIALPEFVISEDFIASSCRNVFTGDISIHFSLNNDMGRVESRLDGSMYQEDMDRFLPCHLKVEIDIVLTNGILWPMMHRLRRTYIEKLKTINAQYRMFVYEYKRIRFVNCIKHECGASLYLSDQARYSVKHTPNIDIHEVMKNDPELIKIKSLVYDPYVNKAFEIVKRRKLSDFLPECKCLSRSLYSDKPIDVTINIWIDNDVLHRLGSGEILIQLIEMYEGHEIVVNSSTIRLSDYHKNIYYVFDYIRSELTQLLINKNYI